MNVRLVSIEQDGIVRLAANGAMTASEMAGDDQHLLASAVGEHWASNRVVLSLAKTDYIDSTAIGWLLSCKKQFDREGGRFVLHSVPPSVQQIFDMLKVGRVLSLAPDETQALALVRGEGADAAPEKQEKQANEPAAKSTAARKTKATKTTKTTKARSTKKKTSKRTKESDDG